MSGAPDLSRRLLLAAPAVLAFAHTAACAQDGGTSRMTAGKSLVAYVTRSGNTRVIAETLHRALGADLFEIRPVQPYPADYDDHVAQAARETADGIAPPLAEQPADIGAYQEIFLGFPIWGQTAPPPIRSFLMLHDLAGKTIRPFITHGGYGVGRSLSIIADHAPGARITDAFVMEADQERRTRDQVGDWLSRIHG